ncbi:MAG: amidohydrolase family protein [Woeseiaceae bacterium]
MLKRATTVLVVASLTACATVEKEQVAEPAFRTIDCSIAAPPVTDGDCEVLAVGERSTIIIGTVLAQDQVLLNGSVLIDADGRIAEVGCDLPQDAHTTVLACPGAIVSPGFVNPHDHIFYNHVAPSAPVNERYDHRHQWRLGLEGHSQPAYERATTNEQLAWSELRQILGGTTSISGLGGVPGLTRNLEDAQLDGDLAQPAAFATVFPLSDAEGRMLADGCDYPEPVPAESFAGAGSFQAHVAEGVDARANNEIGCVMQLLEEFEQPTAFVHFIAASADDAVALQQSNANVVWSPRSNIALYGHTADVTLFGRLGINIALSTDWLPSGSMNMLRELHCAASFSNTYLDGFFTSRELWQMATVNAATSFGLQDEIGSIEPGLMADIAVFRNGPSEDPFEDLTNAADSDLILALRGGEVVAGHSALTQAIGAECDVLPVALSCGSEMAVCLGADNGDLRSILTANQKSYPLMACGAVPDAEPTCIPSRPGQFDGRVVAGSDNDGDGITNNNDNCPNVFNPPRPMDGGLQPDFDRDGAGDACDLNPLE